MDAFPSLEDWRVRHVAELLATRQPGVKTESNQAIFSPLFVDPLSNRDSLLIGLISRDKEGVAGAVSLERLGLMEIVAQAKTSSVPGLAEPHTEIAQGDNCNAAADSAVAFLVDATGRVIHHPDLALIGQDLEAHEGVAGVVKGQAGATYHREPDGQELAIGYAPVTGPG